VDRQLSGVLEQLQNVSASVSGVVAAGCLRVVFFLTDDLRYWEAQSEIGERVQGWVFWTWKVNLAVPRSMPD
jgi:hypothetical protein